MSANDNRLSNLVNLDSRMSPADRVATPSNYHPIERAALGYLCARAYGLGHIAYAVKPNIALHPEDMALGDTRTVVPALAGEAHFIQQAGPGKTRGRGYGNCYGVITTP
jgi:hypothetical protein